VLFVLGVCAEVAGESGDGAGCRTCTLYAGALIGLESAHKTLQNAGPCASGGVCGKTEDTGEVKAEWEASGVSGGEGGYVLIVGLGIIGASLGKGTREAKAGIDLLVVFFRPGLA